MDIGQGDLALAPAAGGAAQVIQYAGHDRLVMSDRQQCENALFVAVDFQHGAAPIITSRRRDDGSGPQQQAVLVKGQMYRNRLVSSDFLPGFAR